ncbi:uncharacterized protein RAG0_14969 [Rhynchosporium agropyri]|uniref:DNA/RNA-binding domain-containing protein n=1 Tax=Rhynchosporium agropyri TaxID=914238 RepID=A0A1E1LJ45_9HELO|nr:uncharacterized protein RAG0_14969 [Rhynchosporium agropyri]
MQQPQSDFNDRWIQHQRRNHKNNQILSCISCPDKHIFPSEANLWDHALTDHRERFTFAENGDVSDGSKQTYLEECRQKKPNKDSTLTRRSNDNDTKTTLPESQSTQGQRPLSFPAASPRSLSGIGKLQIATPQDSQNVHMGDRSDEDQATPEQPRKRPATGDGISNGTASPVRDSSPPRRFKGRHISGGSEKDMFNARPKPESKQLWTEDKSPMSKSSATDPSNIASVQAQRSRAQALQTLSKKSFPATAQISRQAQASQTGPMILGRNTSIQSLPARQDSFDIIMQPETRPISQEQLVAEVKGIYAGLVMVEAKCIEVDNKQATLAQADPTSQPRLNNEQWQALIALHRTLLHEHHDFFLASQHPSASAALRRLASKYAMPARMWRHGIHSFLELLRHRLPASLDHMLAFIYLAYSMMALLYETVPAFEDTWIECLGDLGRYRMAIEDDDIRDREVWTGVARHWYSKASDKSPTTGRLYHHLAILARPNALQQLFYYAKSLCVVIPFTSARESILTLFEPVLNSDNAHGQYRLPPLDTAFVKAHGLLFTNRDMEKFDPTCQEFLGLLDNQIGRVTRKFMEQGYYIAVANIVAVLGFASKANPVVQAMAETSAGEADVTMAGDDDLALKSFERARHLSNKTLEIILRRIGDPNVLPFIHVTLVFIYHAAKHPRAMKLLEGGFPWQSLTMMLNTLLALYPTHARIESTEFPLPARGDSRPFPEDFAMRGLLWADGYYPESWFANDKIDDAEKYLEVASMTDDRKERILFLACRISTLGGSMAYDGNTFQVSGL